MIAETLAQAQATPAEKVKVDYEVLPAVADPAKAQAQGAPQIHEVAPNNTIYQWHLGDRRRPTPRSSRAKHVTKLDIVNNRLVPNAMEPRAAIGDYDAGTRASRSGTRRRTRMWRGSSSRPSSAWRRSTSCA